MLPRSLSPTSQSQAIGSFSQLAVFHNGSNYNQSNAHLGMMPTAAEDIIKLKKEVWSWGKLNFILAETQTGRVWQGEGTACPEKRTARKLTEGNREKTSWLGVAIWGHAELLENSGNWLSQSDNRCLDIGVGEASIRRWNERAKGTEEETVGGF